MTTNEIKHAIDQMDTELSRLKNENEVLKLLLYRMVASHNGNVNHVPYSPYKSRYIQSLRVDYDGSVIRFKDGLKKVKPEN